MACKKVSQKLLAKENCQRRNELLRHGEKFRPYRSVAAWYFWRALEKIEENRFD